MSNDNQLNYKAPAGGEGAFTSSLPPSPSILYAFIISLCIHIAYVGGGGEQVVFVTVEGINTK